MLWVAICGGVGGIQAGGDYGNGWMMRRERERERRRGEKKNGNMWMTDFL